MTEPAEPRITAFNFTTEFVTALAAFQVNIPEIDRDGTVEVDTKPGKDDYSYSYSTLGNLTKTVLPLIAKHGLAFTSTPTLGGDGKFCLRYYLLHTSGGYVAGEFPLKGEGGIQGIGGAITYARRYCLQAATGVATEPDDDAKQAQAEQEAAGSAKTAQRRQRGQAARTEQAAENTARRRQRTETDTPGPPRNPDAEVNSRQQQKLIMQFRDLDISDRDRRLETVSGLMKQPVESVKDLTMGQAHELIEILDIALQEPDPNGALQVALLTADPAQALRRIAAAPSPHDFAPSSTNPERCGVERCNRGPYDDIHAP